MRVFETDVLTIDKVGSPGGDAYLVATRESTLLYDSGFAYGAPLLVAEVENLLHGRPLDFLFLSHSHYDHVSGSPWIKERWPQVIRLGGAHAARVLERPGARETIRNLNIEAVKEAREFGMADLSRADTIDYSLLDRLAIDEVVENGSIIDMGSVALEIIESPGHTRDSLMLWCPEERLLFGSESLGVMVSETMVQPVCLTGYYDSLDSISKAEALHPEHILLSHQHVLDGEEALQYLKNARYWTEKTAHLVWECASVGMSKDKIAGVIKDIYFTDVLRGYQPEAAFDLNNGYVVDQLLACLDEPVPSVQR